MDLAKIGTRGRLGEPRLRDFWRVPLRGLILVAAGLIVPSGALAQQPPFGPLTSEEGAPLQRISYTAAFERADLTARGSVSTDVWLGFSNIFEQDSSATHVLFLDTERLLTAATVRWGAAERLEIGARVTLETTGGGFLDSFVLWYHERLGFGQANRDRFPRGNYAQRLFNGGPAPVLEIPRRTLGLEDVQVFGKWLGAVSADGRSVLSLRAAARIPAQSNLIGEERSDFALLALARLGVGSWYVHGMLGVATARASPELDPILRDGTASFGLALERSLGSGLAGVLQYQIASPLLRGFDHRELDWPASNIVLGLAGRSGDEWSWDVSFQEDAPPDTPAIDFTLGLRVSRTWP